MSKPLKFVTMSDVIYAGKFHYRITAPVHPHKRTKTIENYVMDVLINDIGRSDFVGYEIEPRRFNFVLTHPDLRESLARRNVVIEDLGEWSLDDIQTAPL